MQNYNHIVRNNNHIASVSVCKNNQYRADEQSLFRRRTAITTIQPLLCRITTVAVQKQNYIVGEEQRLLCTYRAAYPL